MYMRQTGLFHGALIMQERRPIAVYGATGHTGRFVVAELKRRGWPVVASGRDAATLEQLRAIGANVRAAALDDPAALNRAFAGCCAVVNCAGPFLDTAVPVVGTALRARIHYLDLTAEQSAAQTTLGRFSAAARQAGVAVLPGAAFFGGLGDLLACATLGDWPDADEITIAIALDSWHPTEGTRATGRRNTAPRNVIRNGRLTPIASPAPTGTWWFAQPFGRQEVQELPFSETILISRHLQTGQLRTWLNTKPLQELRDPSTPPPRPASADGRSAQKFRMECVTRRGVLVRKSAVSGYDIYAMSAPLVAALAEAVVAKSPAGGFAPGEVVEAHTFLAGLACSGLQFEPIGGPA
jgi:hypothetical protein